MREEYGQLAMGWGLLTSGESYGQRTAREQRKADLHRAAVARRRKAKRGGKR